MEVPDVRGIGLKARPVDDAVLAEADIRQRRSREQRSGRTDRDEHDPPQVRAGARTPHLTKTTHFVAPHERYVNLTIAVRGVVSIRT